MFIIAKILLAFKRQKIIFYTTTNKPVLQLQKLYNVANDNKRLNIRYYY